MTDAGALAIAIAKYKGGQPKLDSDQAAKLKLLAADGVPKAALARKFKISRETVYQYIR